MDGKYNWGKYILPSFIIGAGDGIPVGMWHVTYNFDTHKAIGCWCPNNNNGSRVVQMPLMRTSRVTPPLDSICPDCLSLLAMEVLTNGKS